MSIPYDDIGPPIRPLVGFLNERLGVVTVASYGGHENPDEGQAPEGGWWVLVRVPEAPAEWDAFEFLAWVCRESSLRSRLAAMDLSLDLVTRAK
jgi:hypothetical protein